MHEEITPQLAKIVVLNDPKIALALIIRDTIV